ncbi:MAG: hypothetical protein N3J91_13560 [Verrucomicrobiae bacterium]|nr:hypothetical protein [Verrucomicrobiae bacterium]
MAARIFPPRRSYGLLCLILGASMLIWGQTLLASRLHGKTYIIYWTLCFLVTSLALILALWETRRLRIQLQEEEKALFREMVRQIELARREKEARQDSPEPSPEKGGKERQ